MTTEDLTFLVDSFKVCPIIYKGEKDYPYFIHPLTDGALPISPMLLSRTSAELTRLIEQDVTHSKFDMIIAPEAMALPIASMVSLRMDRPFVIVRKRKYDLPGEIVIKQVTGYSENLMYINSIKPWMKVIIIDDVVSTGGTITAITNALENIGVKVFGSYVIAEKFNACKNLQDQGYNVKSLVSIEMGPKGIKSLKPSGDYK
jgi:adenine phosphoribosyltransferase